MSRLLLLRSLFLSSHRPPLPPSFHFPPHSTPTLLLPSSSYAYPSTSLPFPNHASYTPPQASSYHYSSRSIAPRPRLPFRIRRARRHQRSPQLDVLICIEDQLPPHDPQIQSIADTLRQDVPDAIKVAFQCLKDHNYTTRDKSIRNVNRFDKVELSLLLCDDAFIKKLNKEWRDEDSVTDVLSMSQHIPGLAIPILMLGDIVISVETAARQAEERDHTLLDEIRILMVHGLLHLLGFDHEISSEAEEEMVIEEERVLSSLGWKEKGLIKSAYDLIQDEVNVNDPKQEIKKGSTAKNCNTQLSHILFDIDDKLLDNDCQVLRRSAKSLREAISREVNIIVVTEKSRTAVKRAMEMVNLGDHIPVFPGIYLHGTVVCGMQGREIYRASLDKNLCQEAFSYSLGHEIPLVAFADDHCLTLTEHSFVDSLLEKHYEPKANRLSSVQHLLDNFSIQKLAFLGNADNYSRLRAHLLEITRGHARIIETHADMLEIVPLGASKRNGVIKLLNHLEINSDEFEIAEDLKWLGD